MFCDNYNDSYLKFSSLELSSIYCHEHFTFFKKIDLSNNYLANKIHQLWALRKCTYLDLSNNNITDIKQFPKLPNLKVLLLSNNEISNIEDVHNLMKQILLTKIDLVGNPLCNVNTFLSVATQGFPQTQIII